MERTISVLGSTGSIGRQSLDVIDRLGYKVSSLTARANVDLMEAQIRRYQPKLAVMTDEKAAAELRTRVLDTQTRVLGGEAALCDAASDESDTVITAVVGTVGLKPTMAAIKTGKRIALANKETLVCAGRLVMAAARNAGSEILPVDSEHSAIFQCLMGNDRRALKRILLTASGGPFRGWTREQLSAVTPAQALRHPNWTMGAKITIDSATLINKGLEFIEAMHLFNVAPEQIKILIHPQSVIHSMVEYRDNAVIAQLGRPDMRLPIELALSWPERGPAISEPVDFAALSGLTFEEPDLSVFRGLAAAQSAAARTDAAAAVLNAANEAAVALFLKEQIGFTEIDELVGMAVDSLETLPADDLEQILEADQAARAFVAEKHSGR